MNEQLQDKIDRQAILAQELSSSLSLKDFWPECFNAGTCKAGIRGGRLKGFCFRITCGNGEHKEWSLSEVPRKLITDYLKRVNIDLAQDRHLYRALTKIGIIQ